METVMPYTTEIFTAFTSALITWLFSIRKQKTELKKSELDNIEQGLKIYREQMEYLSAQVSYEREQKEIERDKTEKLQEKIKSLEDELINYKKVICK